MRTNAERVGVAEMKGFSVTRASAALPQSAQSPLFTVSGGRVAVLAIIGEVTGAIQAQTTATKVVSNPTIGSDQDLCATADLSGKAAGVLLAITGKFSDTLQVGAAAAGQDRPVVVPTGTIDLSCGGSSTGSVNWTVKWLPVDEGAAIAAS